MAIDWQVDPVFTHTIALGGPKQVQAQSEIDLKALYGTPETELSLARHGWLAQLVRAPALHASDR